MNYQYRGKDTPTDVLSFNIDEDNLLGELYISLDYIKANTKKSFYLIEILRMIIHGTLHLLGYDHSTYFNEDMYSQEEMYIIQEDILKLVCEKYEIGSWVR